VSLCNWVRATGTLTLESLGPSTKPQKNTNRPETSLLSSRFCTNMFLSSLNCARMPISKENQNSDRGIWIFGKHDVTKIAEQAMHDLYMLSP
jgi:hypothetical protein